MRRALATLQIVALLLGIGLHPRAGAASGVASWRAAIAAPSAGRDLVAVRHHAPGAALVRAMRSTGRHPGRVTTASAARERQRVRAVPARRMAPRPAFHRKRPVSSAPTSDTDASA